MIPARLKTGDEIRIIAPSRTIDAVGGFLANQSAFDKLLKMGFKPTFGEYVTGMTPRYQDSFFKQALTKNHYCLQPVKSWSSDPWFLPTATRTLYPNYWKVYNSGKTHGKTVGGNINTFLVSGD